MIPSAAPSTSNYERDTVIDGSVCRFQLFLPEVKCQHRPNPRANNRQQHGKQVFGGFAFVNTDGSQNGHSDKRNHNNDQGQ